MFVRSVDWSNKDFSAGSAVFTGLSVGVSVCNKTDAAGSFCCLLPQGSPTDAVLTHAESSAEWSVADGSISATVSVEQLFEQSVDCVAVDVCMHDAEAYCVTADAEEPADCFINKELAAKFTISITGIVGEDCDACDVVEPESGHLAVPAGGKSVGRIICIKKQQFNL